MPKSQVLSYADKSYQQKKQIYDSIAQVFSDMKNEMIGSHSWNMPVEAMQGVTLRFLGEGNLEITYHRFETTTIEGLARKDDEGPKFIGEVISELKKRFKKHTGKGLVFKKLSNNQLIDKQSRIQADTSWMLGSSRYGYGARPVGRYLLRSSCVYSFDVDALK